MTPLQTLFQNCATWLKDIFTDAKTKKEIKKAEIVKALQDQNAAQCPYKIER